MLSFEERQAAEIEDLRKARDDYASEKCELSDRIAAVMALLNAPLSDEEPDVAAFGRGAWVYCKQHCKPHQTGWCSVSVSDKIGLGVSSVDAAYAKCREWKLHLYGERDEPRASYG